MGFCSRCGEPCALAVCSCGGVAKTPASHSVLYTGRAATPDTDRWERRYVQRSPATTPKASSGADQNGRGPTRRTKHLSLPALAMGGSTFGDVETLKQDDAAPSKTPAQARDRIASSREVQEVEETISRAFGSVLDPAHQRDKWRCHDCNVTFVRDQKVYPDPQAKTDTNRENDLYCPACFAGKFSLGTCVTCRQAVLPDAATPFVQRKDKLWHAMCYACLYCAADLSKSPQVDLYGNPCCPTCFDNAAFLKDPTVARVPALLSAAEPLNAQDAASRQKEEQRRYTLMPMAAKLGPAVSELKTRLTSVGLDNPSAASTDPPPIKAPASQPSLQPSASRVTAAVAAARSPILMPKASSNSGRADMTSNADPQDQLSMFGSARVPVTSPRIAASKAFFDRTAAGHSPVSHSPSPSLTGWKRPSATPIQVPEWRRHRPSQSVPVIPKQVPPASGPSWLNSPLLAGKSAATVSSTCLTPAVGQQIMLTSDRSVVPASLHAEPTSRVSRPLPAPPVSTLGKSRPVDTGVKQNTTGNLQINRDGAGSYMPIEESISPTKVIPSPKKVSAGILDRSRSFRGIDVSSVRAMAPDVSKGRTADREGVSKVAFKKSSSTSELAQDKAKNTRPTPQRARTGLARSNVTFKGKSPVSEKSRRVVQGSAKNCVSDKKADITETGLSSDARCSGCNLRLFGINDAETHVKSHKIIVLPGSDARYHARCFTCSKCKKAFDDGVFVEEEQGRRVHEKCAAPQAIATATPSGTSANATMPVPSTPLHAASQALKPSTSVSQIPHQYASAAQVAPMSPSKLQAKARLSHSGPTKLSKASEIFASREKALNSPVFGGMYPCAGCGEEGSLAETTLGPVGTRFHHKCLRCLCGKQLDSGAKSYEESGHAGRVERTFACKACIDNKNLAKRSLSSMTSITALRG